MQLLSDVKQKAAQFAQDNASTLLTAGGVVGVIGTAVLAGRAGFKTSEILTQARENLLLDELNEFEPGEEPVVPFIEIPKWDKVRLVGIQFVPPVLTGTATIAAIIMSNRMSAQKAAALVAAYGLAERNFSEYKNKIEEKITGPKQKAIDEELAQEAVNSTPGSDRVIIVEGEVLCFDKPTGRYFNSTMETIRQAVNTTNAEIFNHGFTTVNFFYEELGLDPTTWSGEVGFNVENLLDLTYNTIMAPGNRPCIAIDFKSMPRSDYDGPKYG